MIVLRFHLARVFDACVHTAHVQSRARASLPGILLLWSSALLGQSAPPAKNPPADTLRLRLAEARARAMGGNPDLSSARLDSAIARGELRQAGLLRFNPTTEVLTPGGGKGVEYGVTQEIELLGQRGLRLRAGRAGLERASAGVRNATRLTTGDVDRAFFRLYSAARRGELAQEVLGLNQRLATVAEKQLSAGEISRLEYNLALVELGRSRSRLLVARREREGVEVELRRLLGVARHVAIEPVLDSSTEHKHSPRDLHGIATDDGAFADSALAFDVDSLTAIAFRLRPDLTERSAAVQQSEAQASLARREALPNLVLRAASEQEAGTARTFRPGIGITLPVLNLNQGEVQARRAAARQAELERQALATRVRAEIEVAVTAYRTASSEVEVLETTVLAPARQNRQLLETAYREGKVGLPVLLLIRNQVIDAELEYWESWLAEREALARLAEATGTNTIMNPSGTPR